jgi:steroid delta-isomerase-like uncharacterized protein
MSAEENREVVRSLIGYYNAGDRGAAHELISPDCVILDWTGKEFTKDEFIPTMEEFVRAFPDFHIVIEDLIAEGDKVVVRLTESGTMTQDFMGAAPTGQKYTQPAIEIHRIVEGKIMNLWTVRDIATAMVQVGMMPPPE